MKKNQTILVSGGAGFVGCVLTKMLLEKGYKVVIFDKFLFGIHPLKYLLDFKNPNLSIIFGDIRNEDEVKRALDGIDTVIHLAAIVGDPACAAHAELAVEVNFNATIKLASLCKSKKIKRFIFASTCSVYGASGKELLTEESKVNPISLYAETRYFGENGVLSLADEEFSPAILRLGTLFGLSPRMRFDIIVNYFTQKAIVDKKISVFGGEQWRPLLHVQDAASAFIRVLEAPEEAVACQIFNVASTNIKIKNLADLIKEIFPDIELEFKETIQDMRSYRVSIDKIANYLNFKPQKTLEEGVLEIKEAIKKKIIDNPKNKKYYNYHNE